MPPLPASTFARRFRALSRPERRDFLAALARARGRTVERDGDDLLVDDGHGTRRVRVVGRTGRGAAGADAAVVPRDTARVRRRVERTGADPVTPADLREELLYGVPRETGSALARDHLDCDLTVARPPEGADAGGVGRRGLAVVGLALVAALVVAVAAGAVPLPGGVVDGGGLAGSGEAAVGDGTPTGTAALEQGMSESTETTDGRPYPPGLSPDGVENASLLAAAHHERVGDTTYEVRLVYEGAAAAPRYGDYDRLVVTGSILDNRRFHVERNGTRTVDGERQSVRRAAFGDGVWEYHLVETDGERDYLRRPLSSTNSPPERLAAFLREVVARALDTSESRVGTVEARDQVRYQAFATGEPERLDADVENYSAVATVTPEGRVTRLVVRYRHVPTGTDVRIVLSYGGFGDARAPAPDWYRTAANETGTGP